VRRVARALATALLLAALALSVTACGGGANDDAKPTKAAYASEVRGVMDEMEATYGDALTKPSATPEDLEAVRASLLDTAKRLEAITPPAGLETEHEDLVAGVRGLGDAIKGLAEASRVADTNPARAKRLTKEFAKDPSLARITAAAAKLQDAGVDGGL